MQHSSHWHAPEYLLNRWRKLAAYLITVVDTRIKLTLAFGICLDTPFLSLTFADVLQCCSTWKLGGSYLKTKSNQEKLEFCNAASPSVQNLVTLGLTQAFPEEGGVRTCPALWLFVKCHLTLLPEIKVYTTELFIHYSHCQREICHDPAKCVSYKPASQSRSCQRQ